MSPWLFDVNHDEGLAKGPRPAAMPLFTTYHLRLEGVAIFTAQNLTDSVRFRIVNIRLAREIARSDC